MIAIGDKIVIKKSKDEVKVAGGLVMTDKSGSDIRYKKGVVVVAGMDVENMKAGDEIMYDSAAGASMLINSEEYTVIVRRDVAVVI